MRSFLLLSLAVVCALIATVQAGQNWAVLVAGSDGFYNYRHQSDVCHAYQVLKKKGIPDSNIIVFMKDDIANNPQNRHPGVIKNTDNGENVYPGVPKDYTGEDVTPQNFLNVLLGKDMNGVGSGKTLKSTSEDRVFIFFSDHGAPGLVAFPGKMLYAKDLIQVLTQMSKEKKFDQLVFYLEACESGSMFNKLLSDKLRIYATTAANPFESSYACDYNSEERAYLNDCYSFNFINDTEAVDVQKESLSEQFDVIKALTTQSHVCRYGDLSIAKQPIGNFLGNSFKYNYNGLFNRQRPVPAPKGTANRKGISSRDVKMDWLVRQVSAANDVYERTYFEKELAAHKRDQDVADTIFGAFSDAFELHKVREAREIRLNGSNDDRCTSDNAVDVDCIKSSVEEFEDACGKVNEASIKYVAYIRDACEAKVPSQIMGEQFKKTCSLLNH
ncbi:legumain [Acrasis kona]|uniref:legumain n=1 Tax=Acrasis kona TaxID=1008807 RepID=A0AAW2Z560_9EUKA